VFFGRRLSEDITLMSEGAEETAKLCQVSSYPALVMIGPRRIIRGHGHPNDVKSLRDLLELSLNRDPAEVEVTTRSATMKSTVIQ
jgi:hypothetical protein